MALAGDNGAGKTTFIKSISGVFRPTAGEIRLEGRPVSFATPQEARASGIETIYQDLALADNLTIGANIFLGREPMRRKFGFLLDAFNYGPPPHGGIALGLDRVVTLLGGYDTIRDVIAFPKTSTGGDPLTGAPAEVDQRQLRELGLQVPARAPKTT